MNRRGRPRHPDILTPREWEVLEFLREGLSNEQIAERLGVTLRTAKFHVSEILSKLGVESREQAAAWQPEAVPARWLAWPLIARIAGAVVMVAAVAGLGLLAWGVLRTSGGEGEPQQSDPEELVRAALDRMESLDSYRVDVVDSELGSTATVEMMSNGMIAIRTATITSTVLGSVSAQESVFTADGQFDRFCQDYPVACWPWTEGPRPALVTLGPTIPNPDWPLIVLERAEDLRFVPRDTGRPDRVEIVGTVELYAALKETLQRYLRAEAAGDLIPTNRGPVTAVVQVSLSREASAVDTIVIELPESPLSSGKTIGFYYSHFNEVTLSAPTDFVAYTTPTPTP